MHLKYFHPFLCMGLLFTQYSFAADDAAFTESVVIFNTVCARCHEAECSRRLSFEEAFEASSSHIVRHYGEASGKSWLQKELFTLLNHMKEKCAYYPMRVPVPPQRVWSKALLDKMTTLLERNYFIPIGPFATGQYRLEFTLAADERLTVHLVTQDFDMLVEDCYLSKDRRITVPFTVNTAGNYYLRVYPRNPVTISQLVIQAAPSK